MASEDIKRGAGRPKSADPPRVLPLRLPGSLVDRVEAYAWLHGCSRNEAGRRLLELALSPAASGGYNPRTGEFE